MVMFNVSDCVWSVLRPTLLQYIPLTTNFHIAIDKLRFGRNLKFKLSSKLVTAHIYL